VDHGVERCVDEVHVVVALAPGGEPMDDRLVGAHVPGVPPSVRGYLTIPFRSGLIRPSTGRSE
jgi:hypothetical protein